MGSSFVMDTWKKKYSNSKSEAKLRASFEWFWENIDKEGYSIWIMEKADPSEDKMDYVCSNAAGGFLQRCDEIRRWLFGVMNILDTLDDKGYYRVCGVWLIAGQSIAPFDCNPEMSLRP